MNKDDKDIFINMVNKGPRRICLTLMGPFGGGGVTRIIFGRGVV